MYQRIVDDLTNVSGPHPLPNALALVEWVMRALDGTALDGAGKLPSPRAAATHTSRR